jgi:hypothetical protein
MISESKKFIFIHVPRTGGNSMQSVLGEYADDLATDRSSYGNIVGEDGRQGLTVVNQKLFGEEDCKHSTLQDYYDKMGNAVFDYFIFSCMRHPMERFLSYNKYFNKMNPDEDFVTPWPAIRSFTVNGEVRVDKFIMFENLERDFWSVCDRLGIPRASFPHRNATVEENPVVSKGLWDKVYNIYTDDFKLYERLKC